MARTRGASHGVAHMDDGELVEVAPPAVEASEPRLSPEPPKPVRWRCDATTVSRDMDGWDVFRLLSVVMGGLSVELDADGFSALPVDVRRHFKRV